MKSERDDLWLALLVGGVVPATWVFLLGWNFSDALSGHDAFTAEYPFVRDFLRLGAHRDLMLYRPELLGGVPVAELGHLFPIYLWLSYLNLSPLTILNLTVLFFQFLFGFFGTRAVLSLSSRASPSHPKHREIFFPWITGVGLVWCLAFAPLLAWRLSYGHYHVVSGLLFFVVSFAWLVALPGQQLSLTFLVLTVLALLNSFPTSGQQLILYSVVFGGPILVGLQQRGTSLTGLAIFAAVFVGAFGISLPQFALLFHHALGSDSVRSLSGPPVTYAYNTASWRDWLGLLPWTTGALPATAQIEAHENNIPVGPILGLLALWSWRREKALGLGLLVAMMLAIVFSGHLSPFSEWMMAVVAPLKSFRCPNRALLLLALSAILLGLAVAVDLRESSRSAVSTLVIGVPLALLVFLGASWVREGVGWVLVLLFVFAWRSESLGHRLRRYFPGVLLILILGAGSLGAFRERLLPFVGCELVETDPPRMATQLKQIQPELNFPLTRAQFDFQSPLFENNSAYLLGISTIDGYWYPTTRFNELDSLLQGQLPNPLTSNVHFTIDNPAFPVLSQLYNIRFRLVPGETGSPLWEPLPPTAGPAWFSGEIAPLPTMEKLAEVLMAQRNHLALDVREQAWVIRTDPSLLELSSETTSPICRNASVGKTSWDEKTAALFLEVETHASCPLTLAMNYFTGLEAEARLADGKKQRIPVFASFGALTGLWVPADTTRIQVQARAFTAWWVTLGEGVGWGLLVFAAILLWRRKPKHA